ncbi:hypothetical protein E4U41_006522 [Claviceps citrina]|nr:hypothetical protein E4U41_006522 [Claviceps citrina]
MATRSTTTAGRDARHNDFGPTPFPHRPQPASPTLTNPDMILPDYEASEPLQDSSHSPAVIWNPAQDSIAFPDFSSTGYMAGSHSLNTPIIYGNGTMLSDIGEVTEVESTVGYDTRRNSSRLSGTCPGSEGLSPPLRSSPTMGKKTLKKRPQITTRERRLSIESTSTIHTTDVPDGSFGDFDDSVSLDDSSFQGDDEESNASEFVDEKPAKTHSAPVLSSDQALNEESLSTSSISKRAEQILANAKRRLTAMEGNLNRARTFSYSSVSDGSTPSPNGACSNVLPKVRMNPATTSHWRNFSDNSLNGALRINMLPQRSASALGAAGGYRQQLPLSKSADALGTKSSLASLRSPLACIDSILEPLDENEVVEGEIPNRSNSRLPRRGSPSLGMYVDGGTTRTASAAQMRDLHDQMQGLKGKISSLREQAKQDSMKRRSMQSLRALSPFTNAAHDPGFTSAKSTASPDSGSPAPSHGLSSTTPTPENERPGIQGGKEQGLCVEAGEQTSLIAGRFHGACDAQLPELRNDPQLLNVESQVERRQSGNDDELYAREVPSASYPDDKERDVNAEEEEDTCSESGESLYHDTHQEPGDISHEDREDAFDYEHFFLHSAMGALSRQGMARAGSFSSEGSEDSIETARGPAITQMHARRPSLDTITSIDSFATARESGVVSRSSTAQSSRMNDGFFTPTPPGEDDGSPLTTQGPTFGGNGSKSRTRSVSVSGSDSRAHLQAHARHSSLTHRPGATFHRPSVSSFESTGTNRSFPLVNKIRLSGDRSAPRDSPDYKLKQVAESLMNDTASVRDKDSAGSGPHSPAIHTLSREDQLLVEQVVASLGRCVLGLSESARRGTTGNQDHYRRRIEAARKLLENVSD